MPDAAPPLPIDRRGDLPDTVAIRSMLLRFGSVRLLGNVLLRFPYVFSTTIAAGLGVSVGTLTAILGVRELGGLVAPAIGRWSDRGHQARIVAVCGAIVGASCVLAAVPNAWLFAVVMLVGGAAKISIDLTHNVWIGHHVPLERRGRIGGILETTWAIAFLAGVPAIGWIIDRHGWHAAFLVTGPLVVAAAAAGLPVLRATDRSGPTPTSPVGDEEPHADAAPDSVSHAVPRAAPHAANPRLRRGVWVFCAMQPLAQMLVFAVNGDWFATELGLSITELSGTGVALGVAELVGTGLAVFVVDRLGPLRCGMWALVAAAVPMVGIMLIGTNVAAAISLMFIMDVAIEFAFVAVLPLFAELDTELRGRAMGRVFVLIMLARAVGSAVAGALYGAGGFTLSLIAAALACTVGAATLRWTRSGGGATA